MTVSVVSDWFCLTSSSLIAFLLIISLLSSSTIYNTKSKSINLLLIHFLNPIDSTSTDTPNTVHLFQSPIYKTTSIHHSLSFPKCNYSSTYYNPNSSTFLMNISTFSSYCGSTILYRNYQTQYSK